MPKLKKCSLCGRIYRLGDWVYFSNIHEPERKNLSWLIVTDGVEWEFVHCDECKARLLQGA